MLESTMIIYISFSEQRIHSMQKLYKINKIKNNN